MGQHNSGASLLAEWRRKNDYKQPYVAELLGCSQATVSAIEVGKRGPGVQLAAAIATHTGIPLEAWFRDRKRARSRRSKQRRAA